MLRTRHRTTSMLSVAPAAAAALAAVLINALIPLASPLLIALALGAVVANTPWAGHRLLHDHAVTTRLLLRLGVVLLGLRLSAGQLAALGASGLVVVALTVATTFAATMLTGRLLGVEPGLVTLIAAGFSICGAAAIAAVDDAVCARQRDVALAVALVTVCGSAMIAVVPSVASLLGLSAAQAAVWAGASIHEVAQVAAAASLIGGTALATAMGIKLGRVLLLAPVYSLTARQAGTRGSGTAPAVVPWFVAGFLAMVAVRSILTLPAGLLAGANTVTNLLLAASMFGLGLGIRARDLWPVPGRVLLLAASSTAVAAGVSLTLVLLLVR